MRAFAIALAVSFALVAGMPTGDATYGQHYGSLQRGCGPEGVVHVTFVATGPTCAYASHSGYLEGADCDVASCGLRFWHGASARSYQDGRQVSVESFLLVGLERVALCSNEGATRDAYCGLDGEVVHIPLAAGCRRVDMRTMGRAADSAFASRSDSSFSVCRAGDVALLSHPAAVYSVSSARWGQCGLGIQSGCHVAVGGEIGPDGCTRDACAIVFSAWGVVSANFPTARTIATSLTWSTGASVGCAAADVGLVAHCADTTRFVLVIGEGQCDRFVLALDVVDPMAPTSLEESFTLCRTQGNEFDVWI